MVAISRTRHAQRTTNVEPAAGKQEPKRTGNAKVETPRQERKAARAEQVRDARRVSQARDGVVKARLDATRAQSAGTEVKAQAAADGKITADERRKLEAADYRADRREKGVTRAEARLDIAEARQDLHEVRSAVRKDGHLTDSEARQLDGAKDKVEQLEQRADSLGKAHSAERTEHLEKNRDAAKKNFDEVHARAAADGFLDPHEEPGLRNAERRLSKATEQLRRGKVLEKLAGAREQLHQARRAAHADGHITNAENAELGRLHDLMGRLIDDLGPRAGKSAFIKSTQIPRRPLPTTLSPLS